MIEIKSNDIKKGVKLQLTGGRSAEMFDNKKGNIRMVEVFATNGYYNEIGSVYVHEILFALVDGSWVKVIR